MSRHALVALDSQPDFDTVVGWDWGLNTFYAVVTHVDDDKAEEHGPVVWIGTAFNEIHDQATVIDAVRPYAVIPASLDYELYAEAHGPIDEPSLIGGATDAH